MQWIRKIRMVGAHAEGEIGRVITEGGPDIPGDTMLDRLDWLNGDGDWLRRFALFEPRGAAQMTINLLTPPCRPEAHMGFIPMQGDGSHAMSGSNAMCVATVLLETGIIPIEDGFQQIVLDTAAGPITALAECCAGKVQSVSLDFFPSFAEHLDATIQSKKYGEVLVDIAFGGVYYILVDAAQLGLSISPDHAQDLVRAGNDLLSDAREQLRVQHPEFQQFNTIEFCMFTGVDQADCSTLLNATIMPPGRLDRSPCGTGTAARMAVLHGRGTLEVGQQIIVKSVIGSRFQAKLIGVTQLKDRPAILPNITGRAWIFSEGEYGVTTGDPFEQGFTIADTWGDGIHHRIPVA